MKLNVQFHEVTCGDARIVLDAGSGLRALGDRVVAGGPGATTILRSHVHWDHIRGAAVLRADLRAGSPGRRGVGTERQRLAASVMASRLASIAANRSSASAGTR